MKNFTSDLITYCDKEGLNHLKRILEDTEPVIVKDFTNLGGFLDEVNRFFEARSDREESKDTQDYTLAREKFFEQASFSIFHQTSPQDAFRALEECNTQLQYTVGSEDPENRTVAKIERAIKAITPAHQPQEVSKKNYEGQMVKESPDTKAETPPPRPK